MSSTVTEQMSHKHNPTFLMICGSIGLTGCLILVATNMVGSIMVPGHNWITDTISDLAAGKYEFIQDIGLYGYATALFTCALGAAHYHIGETRWTIGILCLAGLAFTIVIVGARNEYGDNDTEGFVIHIYLVYTLGILFLATTLLMADGMGRMAAIYKIVTLICAGLWVIGAPIFFFLPTDMDGLWERALGVITIIWVTMLSWWLLQAGKHKPHIA